MPSILETFGDLPLQIKRDQVARVQQMAIHFISKDTHPLTFNGMMLGVHPVHFKTADYNALFDVFHLHKSDLDAVIRRTPSIDRNFAVISDPYNLLVMWLCHLAPIYLKDKKICYQFQMDLLRLFHYKVFCSVVSNSFRHGAKESVSMAVVTGLSKKSDIVRFESWARLIDSHCEKILDPDDRFYHTLVTGAPDDLFLRVISENQTAIRAKVVTYAGSYYEAHKAEQSIESRSAIAETKDGERIIAQTASVIDSASQAMLTELLNPHQFVNDVAVHDVAAMFTTISARMLKTALLKLNEEAVVQTRTRQFDRVGKDDQGPLYLGMRVLILEIIRSTIRLCREDRVNMGNKVLVFKTMKNAYSSSRITDPSILAVKRSVAQLTDSFNITTNDASRSALRLAVIYYLIYRMIRKM